MKWLEVLAPAKINLFLELLARRADGFHELESIMVTVGLFDRLKFQTRDDDQIQVICRNRYLNDETNYPSGSKNLVWHAIELLRQSTGTPFGVNVTIDKGIPMQAGLGGGSSDAAVTLLSLNRLLQLNQSTEKISEIAAQLGSDTNFFLGPKAAQCTGRGEVIKEIPARLRPWFVIAKPPIGLSTQQVYERSKVPDWPISSIRVLDSLRRGNLRNLGGALSNRLREAAEGLSDWIPRLRMEFDRLPVFGHEMSGSGSSYFGLFRTLKLARRSEQILRARVPNLDTFCVSGLGCGFPVITYHQAE